MNHCLTQTAISKNVFKRIYIHANIYILYIHADIDTYIWCFFMNLLMYMYILCILNSDIKETKICCFFLSTSGSQKNKNCDLHFPTFTQREQSVVSLQTGQEHRDDRTESCLVHLFVLNFFQGTKIYITPLPKWRQITSKECHQSFFWCSNPCFL